MEAIEETKNSIFTGIDLAKDQDESIEITPEELHLRHRESHK